MTGGIGVAISTLGRGESLARCLDSLARGSVLPTTVGVLDQSPDGQGISAAEAFVDRLPLKLEHRDERGLALAQNAAVALTSESVFAVLDDDCVADLDWVARIARIFADDPDLAGIGGRVVPLDDGGGLAVSSRTSVERREFSGFARPWDVGSGNNFALRREWFDRIGGCDPRLGPGSPGLGAVDMDLFHRLLRAGARLRYDPDVLVHHERKSRKGRLGRRVGYGHGMGAACGIWIRSGDPEARRLLRSWFGLRLALLRGELRRGNLVALPEEAVVAGSTAVGLVHGLRRGDA